MKDGTWNYEEIKRLAKKLRCTINDLIVLSPQNDPFYVGTKSEIRSAKWVSEEVHEFLDRRDRKSGHDRAIHYYILSKGTKRPFGTSEWKPYSGDSNDFHWLMKSIQNARYLGLLDFGCIEDNKNPNPEIFSEYWRHDFDCINQVNARTIAENISYNIEPLNPQLQQVYHVEIWTEKSTINDILIPIGNRYGVNVVPFSGQSTTTRIYELIERVTRIGKPARILYISDYDVYGQNMPVSCGRKIQWFLHDLGLEIDIKLKKILLTEEQVKKYELPSAPDAKFKVEIDALEVFYPKETWRIVEETVADYIDLSVKKEVESINSEIQRNIYRAIMNREDIVDSILREVDFSKIERILSIELPKAKAVDETDDVIFDSSRSYQKQTTIFKDYLERQNK